MTVRNHENKSLSDYHDQIPALLAQLRDIDRTAEHLGIKTATLRRRLRVYPELLPPGMTLPRLTTEHRFTDEQLLALL